MNATDGQQEGAGVESFGRIPFRIVAAGLLAKMTAADVKVFTTIAAHASKDWQARPSVKRIAELTGLTERGVWLALARLQRLRVLTIHSGGGRGVANTYLLTQNPEATFRVLAQIPKSRTRKPEHPSPETLNGHARNPECPSSETLNRCAQNPEQAFTPTERTENEQNRTARNAAADGVRAELTRYGITEPKLSELGSLPGLTVNIVRDLAGRIGKAANPGGLLVALVEREGSQLVQAEQRKTAARQAREASAQQKREAEALARAEQETELAHRRALIAALSDVELVQRTDAALSAAGTFHANRWERIIRNKGYRAAVMENRGLLHAVCQCAGY